MPANTLRAIHAFPDLVRYLEDELDWPLKEYGFDELTFEYTPAELGLKEEDAAHIKAIHQLRPLASGQPWGIFFVEFENKKLPVVVLRRILSHLVIKKRASANKAAAPAWHAEDLLFVTAFGEDSTDNREIAFAHFHQTPGDLPTLHVLGWDGGDTPLKLANVDRILHERLHWPEDESDANAWRETWRKPFKHKLGQVIRTADLLAEELARLARGIRDKAKRMLAAESDKGPLTKLYQAFQTALIHDLTPESFADTYAQTITYGLLTAAISRTEMSEGRHGTALLADDIANIVPVTNPFLKEMLQTFLKVGGRKGGIDFDELGIQDVVELLRGEETDLPAVIADFGNKTRGEDPVIHFYEHFLNAYNRQLKIQRGVFYTPQPVVSYIVRSVHELLQTEFGLEHGLASTVTWAEMAARKLPSPASGRGVGGEGKTELPSPLVGEGQGVRGQFKIPEGTDPNSHFVTILDPATGTATFLVEVISVIHRTLTETWAKQGLNDAQRLEAWNEYVPRHLLPRLYGYELMMAPYAIAHMKIGLKLHETGYRFGSEERVRVYLTNALEPAHEVQRQLEALAPALAHEAQAVAAVKRDARFTVVLGNPPYSLASANMEPAHRALVERYKFIGGDPLRERGALQLEKILNDDYVKFIAKSQDFITAAGTGLVGLITNHAYLDNPTMRGLRHSFFASFKLGYFYDLGGSAKKVGENTDENVFDIQQGVAICITVKIDSGAELVNRHAQLVGVRETKYKLLAESSVKDTVWSKLSPSLPYYLFVPTDYELRSEYDEFIPLSEVFPLHSIGCFTSKDHFVISRDPQQLVANAKVFRDSKLPDKDLCAGFEINAKDAWDVSRSREQIRQLNDGEIVKRILRFTHRPFDIKHIFFHRSLVWSLAYPVNRNLMKSGNLALVTSRQLATPPWNHVFCSNSIVEMFLMSNKTKEGNHVFPLYVLADDDAVQRSLGNEGSRPNFFGAFLRQLSTHLLLSQDELGQPRGLTPEDIFHYIYAVFHSPSYRTRYTEFLKIDFPRIPLPGGLPLFQALAKLGGDLIALHLLESPKVNESITRFEGNGDNSIPKKSTYKDGAVWINATQRFEAVPEAVWNFHIGGYQVCEKWLKDRKGRTLSDEDIAHYQRVVVALFETIRLMAEIDRVIDAHGGWPGAFKTAGEGDAAA